MEFKEELKRKIIFQNEVYRSGNPLDVNFVTDAEWDYNLEQYESLCIPEEFEQFRVTLMEQKGNKKHEYVIGSLFKIKYGEDQLLKWLTKNRISVGQTLFCSAKIDGCSFVAKYRNGMFISCYSRGDGKQGEDWSNKAKYILPSTIPYKDELDIRGEFTLTNDSHIVLGFKNRRNGTVGCMNSKEVEVDKLEHIRPYVYQILNSEDDIASQIRLLENIGFMIPEITVISISDIVEEDLKETYFDFKKNLPYDIDGLVISSPNALNENDKFFPDYKAGFKVNSTGVKTKIVDYHFELSKGGLLKPICLVKPVEIDGTTVSRVTGYNCQYILDNEIGIGSEVLIIKSGAIIPKIIGVMSKASVALPTMCPSCGELLDWKGVDLHCGNPDCNTSSVKRVFSFLRDCGVENVADKTLENWNIITFDDLLAWKPETGSKSQNKFAKELDDKVFSKPFIELFSHMVFDGCGTTNILKLVEFYGFDAINAAMLAEKVDSLTSHKGFPVGIGNKIVSKIVPDWKSNIEILTKLTLDPRYKPKLEAKVERKEIMDSKLNGKKILFTGTLSCKRSEAEEKAKDQGAIIASSVNKELDYLVVGEDQWGKSSKFLKAEKIGVKILTEAEFNTLIG